jgi:cell filamentation protein
MAEDPYVYPGTDVLRNKFGLRDATVLAELEHELSAGRAVALRGRPLPGGYDFAHLKAFHRRLFGDVYPWAGERRTVPIAKGNTLFALPDHIEPYLDGVLGDLPREDYLRGTPADHLPDRLAHYMAEINAAHPFREGNGRTQRAFIAQLAAEAGHHLAWEKLTADRNIAAAVAAMGGNNSPLRAAIAEVLVPAGAAQETGRNPVSDARANAQARFDALAADPDNPALLEASFEAQRAAEQLKLDSRPRWLTDTLGERPADPKLAGQWDQLGVSMIRLRASHGLTDEIDNGVGLADVLLQRSIGRFRLDVGLDQPSPGANLPRGRGIND